MKDVFPESNIDINLRNKPTFKTTNVKSVNNGTETISFRGPQIWSIVPNNIKNSQMLSHRDACADYVRRIFSI